VRSQLRLAASALLALALGAPVSAAPITVSFSAVGGPDTASGSFVYEGNVGGSGTITGPPYGGSITLPSSTFVSAEVRWIVQTSGCATGGACVTLGLTEPLGGGLVHLATLVFAFSSLPSADLPDPATLAAATSAGFLDLVLDGGGVVQSVLFSGAVTSLSFVPEPGAGWLLAGAFALSRLRRRAS
jgi:hypothetical protein